jgi:hypothetical protein
VNAKKQLEARALEEFKRRYFTPPGPGKGLAFRIAETLLDNIIASVAQDNKNAVTRYNHIDLEEWATAEGLKKPKGSVDRALTRMAKRVRELTPLYVLVDGCQFRVTVTGPTSVARGEPGTRGAIYLVPDIQVIAPEYAANTDATSSIDDDEEEDGTTADEARKEFARLLTEFSSLFSATQQATYLHGILVRAWRVLAFDHAYSASLLGDTAIAPACRAVIEPYCLLALNRPSPPDVIDRFVATTTALRLDRSARQQVDVAWVRVLRGILYQGGADPPTSELMEWLSMLATDDHRFWRRFFVDLHFRIRSAYVAVPEDTATLVETVAERYFEVESGAVLTLLRPYFHDVLGEARALTREGAVEFFLTMAERANDLLDCRWTIAAFERVLPLLPLDDDDADHAYVTAMLFEKMDNELWTRNAQLLFMFLHCTLKAFIARRTPGTLKTFEDRFVRHRRMLLPPHRTHLQLEYAAAVYVEGQFTDFTDSERDLYVSRLSLDPDASFIGSPLFANEIAITAEVPARPDTSGGSTLRYALLSWLLIYMRALRREYATDAISRNVLKVRDFRLLCSVADSRGYLAGIVETRLRELLEHAAPTPTWSAMATSLFEVISPLKNRDLLRRLAERVEGADRYVLARSARHVFQGLLMLHRYGDDKTRSLAGRVADAVFEQVEYLAPRLWWMYYAAIRYERDTAEQEFVAALWERATLAGISVWTIGEGGVFQMETKAVAKAHAWSKFATIASLRVLSAELWNTIATTSLRAAPARSHDAWNRAAVFYRWADACAREAHHIGQKYWYNYVYARASAILEDGPTDVGFVRAAVRQLAQPIARQFGYRPDRLLPFASLLVRCWGDLPADLQQEVERKFPRIKGLPLSFVDHMPRLELGDFRPRGEVHFTETGAAPLDSGEDCPT